MTPQTQVFHRSAQENLRAHFSGINSPLPTQNQEHHIETARRCHYVKYDDTASFALVTPSSSEKIVVEDEFHRNMRIPEQVKHVDDVIYASHYNIKGTIRRLIGLTLDYKHDKSGRVAVVINTSTPTTFGTDDNLASKMSINQADYMRGVVDHEMGYVFYNSLPLADQVEWEGLYRQVDSGFLSTTIVRCSKYAVGSSIESFAKAYLAYMNKLAMPYEFKEYFDMLFNGHNLHESEGNGKREKRPDDVMIRACGFDQVPSYVILRDGTEIMTYDPFAEANDGNNNTKD